MPRECSGAQLTDIRFRAVVAGQDAVVFFTAVNIRKFVLHAARLDDLVGLGSLSPRAATFLDASVRAGLNILRVNQGGSKPPH